MSCISQAMGRLCGLIILARRARSIAKKPRYAFSLINMEKKAVRYYTFTTAKYGEWENKPTSLHSQNLFIKTDEYCTPFVSNS
ncbi:MAG TPA: hypothetical protein OIM03_10155 [Veillonellaceae bacterium]|nr:hypothetical protein [Veillonellaceae bacterium]